MYFRRRRALFSGPSIVVVVVVRRGRCALLYCLRVEPPRRELARASDEMDMAVDAPKPNSMMTGMKDEGLQLR
jgi:hypothetical protein